MSHPKPDDLSREDKANLFVLGVMESLVRRGFVSGKPRITPRGIGVYDQLKASGYRPTRAEIRIVLDVNKIAPKDQLDLMTRMVEAEIEVWPDLPEPPAQPQEKNMLNDKSGSEPAPKNDGNGSGKAKPGKTDKEKRKIATEEAIKLAGAAAAKAVYSALDGQPGEAANRKSFHEDEDEIGLSASIPPRRRSHYAGGLPSLTVAEVTWGSGEGSVRLVRHIGLGRLSIEGDLATAPKWALRAITEAVRLSANS